MRSTPARHVQEAVRAFISQMSQPRLGKLSIVIACSKQKAAHPAPARQLYRSGRFLSQLRIADHFSEGTFVLSAKHGVVAMDETVEPYDVTYPHGIFADGADIPNLERLKDGGFSDVVFFGGTRYLNVLRKQLPSQIKLHAPFEHLNSYSTALWGRIIEDYLERRKQAPTVYEALSALGDKSGVHEFSRFSKLSEMPQRGVYFFFDPSEPSDFSTKLPRMVRVGTHGVSIGSKSTLRTRLRAHFGQQDETGNHRASIFRLHVGNALLAQQSDETLVTWGHGMSADKQVRESERPLEVSVSRYISSLLVTYVQLLDMPSVNSQRSLLERSTINFFGADMVPLEEPSQHWLGSYSPNEKIKITGLWNLQYNGERYVRKAPLEIIGHLHNPMLPEA